MIIFDGNAAAAEREKAITQKVAKIAREGQTLTIAAVLFTEDEGSRLYTQLKGEAAKRVGIIYRVEQCSLRDDPKKIVKIIKKLNTDPAITGIIIQKPWRKTWMTAHVSKEQGTREGDKTKNNPSPADFSAWWKKLTSAIALEKDVDGLHPKTLRFIKKNTWLEQGSVMPATARAVLLILELARNAAKYTPNTITKISKHIIIGKSDIVGQPLFYEIKNQGYPVEMIGRTELDERIELGTFLKDAAVIISATGSKNLITGQMVSAGVVVIDVGEPRPDVEFATVAPKAAFITPVPGGVGPLTVVSLLENCVELASRTTSSSL